jgi:hypothetical protein
MELESSELCPICINAPAEYFTECNHSFCINCLCRIDKCAMCRNPLQKSQLCIEIKNTLREPPYFVKNSGLPFRFRFGIYEGTTPTATSSVWRNSFPLPAQQTRISHIDFTPLIINDIY